MIDPMLLLQQTINFLILVFLLRRYLYEPVRSFLQQRADEIKSNLQSAEREKEEAEKLRVRLEQELADSKRKAQEFLEQAARRSEQLQEEMLTKARQESDAIKARAREEIQQERESALKALRRETIDLSFEIASRVVRESLDKKKHQKLVNQVLVDLDQFRTGEQHGR